MPVSKTLTPRAPFKLLTLPAFKYIELVTNCLEGEWKRIRRFADDQGFERTFIEREVHLYWQGFGHRQTKIALQVGIR